MKEKSEFDVLKKKYGENFAKLCRTLFPTILEQEGLLTKLITENFAESHFLYEDIIKDNAEESFKNYIFSLINVENDCKTFEEQSPEELLEKAGYTLYKCETEEEIQAFKKYYGKGEELCTFMGGRLKTDMVFFAVKKNVDEIRRENFPSPKRQDEYGTSVISIQFTRGNNSTLSIKNRYNHRVNNPDATFSNNLDNIISGLTDSFVRTYNIDLVNTKHTFELDHYVLANNGKFYKYNYEIFNTYYCPNNIIIDGGRNVKQFDKKEYLVFDYFVLDFKAKKVILIDELGDSFIDGFEDINKIIVQKKAEGKDLIISVNNGKDIIITLDKQNRIIKYENENLEKVSDAFLYWNETIKELYLLNLKRAGDEFLCCNKTLEILDLPNLIEVWRDFLYHNESLVELNLQNLREVGDEFLCCNEKLIKLNAPNLTKTGISFLFWNNALKELSLLSLTETGDDFLYNNEILSILNVPNLDTIKLGFLRHNPNREKFFSMIKKQSSQKKHAPESELL